MEAKLEQKLASAEYQKIIQFQLACILKEMSDLLDIHTSEPMPVLDHLKYIWGCLTGCKIVKTRVQEQEILIKQQQLELEMQQNELTKLHQSYATQLEILLCTDASARQVHFLETELEKTQATRKSLQDQLLYFARQINAAKGQILVAKTKETMLQSELKVAIEQSAYPGKALQCANARILSLGEEISACYKQIQALKATIETERQSKAQLKELVEQVRHKIATLKPTIPKLSRL